MGKNLKGKELGKGFSQRKDGRYIFRFTDRFGNRNTLYNDSLSELKKESKKIVALNDLKLNKNNTNITLNDLYDMAMKSYIPNNLKITSLIVYKRAYENYIKNTYLGKTKLCNLKVLEIQEFLTDINNSDTPTVAYILKCMLSQMFNFAVLYELRDYNPITSIKYKKNDNKEKVESLTDNELNLFIKEATDSKFYNLFILLLNTGLRISEAIALTEDDIDFENEIININKQLRIYTGKEIEITKHKYSMTKPKRNSIRKVPMNDTTKEILRNQIQISKQYKKDIKNNKYHYDKYLNTLDYNNIKNLIFINKKCFPIKSSIVDYELYKIKNNIMNKYNMKIKKLSCHVLRHTFTTLCYHGGMNQKLLSIILGHKNISTTNDVYVSAFINGKETQNLLNLN